jgi:O-antigen ligase
MGIALLYFLTLFPHSAPSEQMGALISTMTTRVTSIGNASDESIAWRGVVWSSAFHAFSQNIFSGTGFGVSVPVEIADYREFVEIRNIHNSWLALLIQTGLLGFGLFVLFLSRLAYRAWRLRSKDALLETAKYVTMGILLFHSIIFLSQPYLETNLLSIFFWINLGVMRTLLAYEDSRNK